jgi:hypothetical protein
VCHELINLALTQPELPFLTASLFDLFRQNAGQPIVLEYFAALQNLASGGTPAGARLLAAFLDVSTPGERLMPRLQHLDSGRRYETDLAAKGAEAGQLRSDWLRRLHLCRTEAARLRASGVLAAVEKADARGPRSRQPWPELRGVFAWLVQRAVAGELRAGSAECALLASLLRLEIDAWQERVSRLAGSIDPFRVAAVMRVLPYLNQADAEIRDLRQMTTWVNEGNFEAAFVQPQARWRETIEDKDWAHLVNDLRRRPELAGLARLAAGLAEKPILLAPLATGILRIISVSEELVAAGVRSESLDLFTACMLAQAHHGNGQIVLTLDQDLVDVLASVLPTADEHDHPLQGVSIVAGLLVIELSAGAPELEHGLPVLREESLAEKTALAAWRHARGLLSRAALAALPEQGIDLAAVTGQPEGSLEEVLDEVVEKDISAAALKHLVLTNIQSVSVLLGFLRNPKVFGIPGLVADVAVRTRNPQIIAVIATDRALHTGYANKGVPVACLRSPVNVSVKILRKFCHVKYVSKLELKRLAADRTGIRKEVAREIEKYLEALA